MNQFFSHSGVSVITGDRTFLRESLGPPRVQGLMWGDLGHYSEDVLPSALLPDTYYSGLRSVSLRACPSRFLGPGEKLDLTTDSTCSPWWLK